MIRRDFFFPPNHIRSPFSDAPADQAPFEPCFRPALLGAWAFVFALDSSGADWPQFRGPDRNDISHETGLLKKLGKASLTVADGMLYLRLESGEGTVVLLEPVPAAWNEKGRFDPPGRSDKFSRPHPVVANGRLYLRNQDILLAYDGKRR